MAIEIIKSIAFAPVNKVIEFIQQGHSVQSRAYWKTIPMHVASGQLTSMSKQEAAGTAYTTNISVRLKESIGMLEHGIFKVELCSGRTLIVGTPDIPVRANENISLSLTSLSITHNSIDPPLELVLSTPTL